MRACITPMRSLPTQVLLWIPDETPLVEPPGNGTSYKTFIDLLTTVQLVSVLTAFATYFGVIQRDWHNFPLVFFVCLPLVLNVCSCGKCWRRQQHSVQTTFFFFFVFFQTLTAANMPRSRVLANISMIRPVAGRQTFSRNIDKIQIKKKKWFQQLSSGCLSLVCSPKKKKNHWCNSPSALRQAAHALFSLCFCCQLRSKGWAEHETFPTDRNLTRSNKQGGRDSKVKCVDVWGGKKKRKKILLLCSERKFTSTCGVLDLNVPLGPGKVFFFSPPPAQGSVRARWWRPTSDKVPLTRLVCAPFKKKI